MRRNTFYAWLLVAVLVFAALSLGGCGGGSDDSGSENASDSDVTMSEIFDDDAAAVEIFNKLTSEDVFKLAAVRMTAIEKNEDGTIAVSYMDMPKYILEDKEPVEGVYDAATLRTHYESGDIILIGEADRELVNKVRADLGLALEDSDKFGASGSLEVYGLACIKTDGLRNLFVYVVPRMGDIVENEAAHTAAQDQEQDTSTENLLVSEDAQAEKEEVTQQVYTMRDFQIDRWVHFFKWMGNIAVEAVNNAAFASEYKLKAAANDDLTAIADAQTETFNFSYNDVNTSYSIFTGRYTYSFKRSRNNFVNVTIYSAHSFSSGKDYYVVQSTTTTVPRNFTDTYINWNDYKRNVLYGYTRTATTEHYIDGGNMSTSDVALIRHAPANINENTTYSEGMSWSVNGKVGVNKDGASAEVGGGVTYSNSKTWSVSEYKLVNDSMKDHPASAKWYVDVQKPSDGSTHYVGAPFIYYQGVNATNASKNQIQFDSYFMWEVGSSYWRNHPDMKMYVKFNVEDGFCMGWCNQGFKEYSRYDESDSKSSTQSVKLKQPTHTTVSQRNFTVTASGASAQAFTLLAEDSWTISNVPSWIKFTETSGTATGSSEKQLLFDVSSNTSGSPRTANITLKSGRDEVTIQVVQTGI